MIKSQSMVAIYTFKFDNHADNHYKTSKIPLLEQNLPRSSHIKHSKIRTRGHHGHERPLLCKRASEIEKLINSQSLKQNKSRRGKKGRTITRKISKIDARKRGKSLR